MKNIQYRISDGRYIGRKQIKNHIITVYAQTQKECAEKLKQRIDEILTKKIQANVKKNTFSEIWDNWYENNKKPFITKETQAEIERIKKKLQDFHSLSITKVNTERIQLFLKTLPEDRAKEKIILYLKACLKNAFENGYIKSNPFANIVVRPRLQHRKPAFTYEQQKAILERIDKEPIKPIILIYLATGLRRRELDFQNIANNIDRENCLLKALNLKGRNLVKRYKTIQLSKTCLSIIMNNIDLLKSYNEERAYREFKDILTELNIQGSIVNLRHTFATNNFYLGNPELFISRQMGHSTSQITKDNYTDIDYHLSKEKILKLYNNLYYLF